MAKRRKVGNLLALSLLSVLMQRPMYPYEMASVLREYGKDQAIKINWGSLYTVVQNLEKNGFIEAVQVAREGRQPERTTYRITDEGQDELRDWLRELLGQPEREYTRFEAGLSDSGILPPDEVITLLRQRLESLDAGNDRLAADLANALQQVPRLFMIETEFHLAMRRAEAEWVRGLLAELEDGTFPRLDFWRALHKAGVFDGSGRLAELPEDIEVPPELRALVDTQEGAAE